MPKFRVVSEEEKKELVKRYGDLSKFPKMLKDDPVAKLIGAKPGDVVEIERRSEVAGNVKYFRLVVESVFEREVKEEEEEFLEEEVEEEEEYEIEEEENE